MASLATLQSRLTEAETALHKLHLGEQVASVTGPDGRSLSYTKADVDKLEAYIRNLTDQIAAAKGETPTQRRGIGFEF